MADADYRSLTSRLRLEDVSRTRSCISKAACAYAFLMCNPGFAMAIHFKTSAPNKLLAAYKKAVDDGHVATWSYDSDGDFTHTPDQWIKKAWLRPKIRERQELIMYILSPKEVEISSATYAVYHGRFIESVLRHCDGLFVESIATALPESGDRVGVA